MPETEKQRIGRIGEDTACRFLSNKGFSVIERNYRKKWGEIDIVASKKKRIHFVEVKTVTREKGSSGPFPYKAGDFYRPEDNVHPWKLKRLARAIQTYLLDRRLDDREWQLDVVVIFLDEKSSEARIRLIENIVL